MKRLLVLVLLCSCSPKKQPEPETFKNVLSLFRQGELEAARDRARAATAHCGTDLTCQWRFRLLEAEALIWLGKDEEARALLAESPPPGAAFTALAIRRQMLEGYYLLPRTQPDARRAMLDQAHEQASRQGLHILLPEIEILQGNLASSQDPQKARSLFLQARAHAAEQHDSYDEAAALNNLGMLSLEKSRYDEAIPFFEQVLDPARQADARQILAAAFINLGLCYTELGAYDEAVKHQQEAIAWLGTAGSPVIRRNLLSEMGRTLQLKGELQKAIRYYREALNLSKGAQATSDAWISADDLANALAESQDWDAAEEANREEAALAARENGDRPKAYVTLNAAIIAAGRKRFNDAIARYQQAIRLGAKDTSINWEANAGMAQAYAASGNKLLARRHYEAALALIDSSQAGLSRDEYKLTFLASLIRFYRHYVDLLMENGDYLKALEVVESSRARILAATVKPEENAHRLTVSQLQLAARRSGTISSLIGSRRGNPTYG